MIFHRIHAYDDIPPGRRMVREHSNWLSDVFGQGRADLRIPVRKVSRGGFARLTATAGGRALAARWWEIALQESTG